MTPVTAAAQRGRGIRIETVGGDEVDGRDTIGAEPRRAIGRGVRATAVGHDDRLDIAAVPARMQRTPALPR